MSWPRRPELLCLPLFLSLSLAITGLAGCHSASINAVVSNRTARAISIIQVGYPSASFGVQTLAPGQDFKYRFKVLGSGTMNIDFTDSANVEHKATGPLLNEGSEGSLTIVIGDSGVQWQSAINTK